MITDTIKDFYGKTVAFIETDEQGNKVIKDCFGKVLGGYDKCLDVTTDAEGDLVAKGDGLMRFIGR